MNTHIVIGHFGMHALLAFLATINCLDGWMVIQYSRCIDESIRDASAVFIVTEWEDIQTYPLEKYVQLMREPILFDGRNCYTDEDVKKQKIDYYSVGRKSICNRKVSVTR